MQEHYEAMPQDDLLRLLPQRSWHSISHQAAKNGTASGETPEP